MQCPLLLQDAQHTSSRYTVRLRIIPTISQKVNRMKTCSLLVALSVAALLPSFSFAAETKGDLGAGRTKFDTCTGCHGVPGYKNAFPNYHVPRIAGQNYEYLISALTGYKKGERPHPTMRAQGESLTDQDIRDIAAYLSSLGKN